MRDHFRACVSPSEPAEFAGGVSGSESVCGGWDRPSSGGDGLLVGVGKHPGQKSEDEGRFEGWAEGLSRGALRSNTSAPSQAVRALAGSAPASGGGAPPSLSSSTSG